MKNLSEKVLAELLKEGDVAVMPTDTIYGICGSALDKKAVKKIYALKKRPPQKPAIILISNLADLNLFGIKPSEEDLKILKKLWPGKISVILDIKDKEKIKGLKYLHRGIKTLAFRLPKKKSLVKILTISGPLIAPSANLENHSPAKTIAEAKKYFGSKVIYYNKGRIAGRPSTLVEIKNRKIETLRKGSC